MLELRGEAHADFEWVRHDVLNGDLRAADGIYGGEDCLLVGSVVKESRIFAFEGAASECGNG